MTWGAVDGRDQVQAAAAPRAGEDIDVEGPPHQVGQGPVAGAGARGRPLRARDIRGREGVGRGGFGACHAAQSRHLHRWLSELMGIQGQVRRRVRRLLGA